MSVLPKISYFTFHFSALFTDHFLVKKYLSMNYTAGIVGAILCNKYIVLYFDLHIYPIKVYLLLITDGQNYNT